MTLVNRSSAPLINQQPRPRVLIVGFHSSFFGENDEALRPLVGTLKRSKGLDQEFLPDWDALVTDQPLFSPQSTGGGRLPDHLSVIYFDSRGPGRGNPEILDSSPEASRHVRVQSGHFGRELRTGRNLAGDVAFLFKESRFLEVLAGRESHVYFTLTQGAGQSSVDHAGGSGEGAVHAAALSRPPAPPQTVPTQTYQLVPFITTSDGQVLAGRYSRSDQAEVWLLPHDIPNWPAWFTLALREFHQMHPDRFPGLPNWTLEPQWQTEVEQAAAVALTNLELERRRVLDELNSREEQLRSGLAAANEQADQYERMLMTGQHDQLEDAVSRALVEIGFDVERSDGTAVPGDRLQDLLVRDPAHVGWVALVEVKGYTGGAKTAGITQLLRFQARYTVANGRSADALWYIPNQFLARDPGERPLVLSSAEEDVNIFAEDGGLVIDTLGLFRLLIRVRRHDMTAQTARDALRAQTGQFDLTSPKTS